MPFSFNTGDGIDALAMNQSIRGARRDGVVINMNNMPDPGECRPAVGGSTSVIDIDVDQGSVRLNGTVYQAGPDTVVLDDGHPDHPRRDVVYATAGGNVSVLKGPAGPPATDDGGDPIEGAAAPLPDVPDGANLEGVPIAVVWVPAGATDSTDLDQTRDVWDRRVPIPAGDVDQLNAETVSFKASTLEAGDSRSAYLPVEPGSAIRMLEWGIGYLDNANPDDWFADYPPPWMRLELVAPNGSVVSSTADEYEKGSPIFFEESNSNLSGVAGYWIRLRNVGNSDIAPPEGVAAYARYEVV